MKLTVLIHKDEDGGYWAEVPAIKGCYTQGDTLKELKENIREAISGCLAAINERAQKIPSTKRLEISV